LQLSLDLMHMNLEPRSVAGVCAIVFLSTGTLFLWLALLAERGLRGYQGARDEKDPAFVSARKFTLVAGVIGYLYLFGFVISPWLCRFLPGIAVALVWVVTVAALWDAILRFFQRRPPTGQTRIDESASRDSG
jgi:hypothetical protein